MADARESDHEAGPPRLGGRDIAAALAGYAACAAAATYPRVAQLATALPNGGDPLQHLWVMRWWKTCLQEGRSPWLCPDIQYPVGAPIGNFSPLHLESLLYLPLSAVVTNDVLCYNLLWSLAFLLNGMGTFFLTWYVLRNRACAWLGGLLAMLSGPVMVHAQAHLELIYVGFFPVFLVAWMRFVDRPGRGRLLAAAGAYVLVAMSAAYFMLQAIFPALLYVGWSMARSGRRGVIPWARARIAPFSGFGAVAGTALLVLFSGHVWAALSGHSATRPRSGFEAWVAPLWGYAIPSRFHRLRHVLPFDVYEATGFGGRWAESVSYLGVVTLALIYYAMTRRVAFPRARFWWAASTLLVVLSLGPYARIGAHRLSLPDDWLWTYFPIIRGTRNPGRFNLHAAVGAALLAAAGLRHLLGRLETRRARAALVGALTVVAVADLGVPFEECRPLPYPRAYEVVKRLDPRPNLLEVPLSGTAFPTGMTAASTYWQAIHGGTTTAGYSGNDNRDFDNLMYDPSPFSTLRPFDPPVPQRMSDPDYLKDPDRFDLGVAKGLRFRDYAWLYLAAHRLRFVILHKWDWQVLGAPGAVDRLRDQLADALLYEDEVAAAYDAAKLPPPTRPTLLCTDGWRHPRPWETSRPWRGRTTAALARTAHLVAYNPDPDRPLTLTLEAEAYREPRTVRLLAGGRELARWRFRPGEWATATSPPFRLPAGSTELTLAGDGEATVARRREAISEVDRRPYSLRVSGVTLGPAPGVLAVGEEEGPARARARR